MHNKALLGNVADAPCQSFTFDLMSQNTLAIFDRQLYPLSPLIRDELSLTPQASNEIATTIYNEVLREKERIMPKLTSRSPVSLNDMMIATQQAIGFNASLGPLLKEVGVAFAYTLSMNYMTFVYYRDHLFRTLMEGMPEATATRDCARFLYSGDSIYGLRHGISHGNWRVKVGGDVCSLEFWYKIEQQREYTKGEINQRDLVLVYTLARAVAYAALHALEQD